MAALGAALALGRARTRQCPRMGLGGPGKGHGVTCAKQVVKATIIALDGREFTGFNDVLNPQMVCPRGDMPSNVGYHLCRDVCQQPGHAEVMAIAAAGEHARGATLILEGHKAVCPACLIACEAAGIARIEVKEKAR